MSWATFGADWLTKLVGMDDQHHHGVSFSKVVVAWFAWCVGMSVMAFPLNWAHVIAMVALLAAALSRAKFDRFLDLLHAKWSATSTDTVATTIDLAQTMAALKAKAVEVGK